MSERVATLNLKAGDHIALDDQPETSFEVTGFRHVSRGVRVLELEDITTGAPSEVRRHAWETVERLGGIGYSL